MNAEAAADMLSAAASEISLLRDWQQTGFIRGNTAKEIEQAIDMIDAVSSRFLNAVAAVAASSIDDLLLANADSIVKEHVRAYNACETAAAGLSDPDADLLQVAMAVAAADANYTAVIESQPLHPVVSDKDLFFTAPTLIEQTVSPVLVSTVRRLRPTEPTARKRKVEPETEPARKPKRPVRRSARIAALQAPKRKPPPDLMDRVIKGSFPDSQELQLFVQRTKDSSQKRLQQRKRPRQLTFGELPREIAISNMSLNDGDWTTWIRQLINDPSTRVLDLVAGSSGILAGQFSVSNAIMSSAMFVNAVDMLQSNLGVDKVLSRQAVSSTLTTFKNLSLAVLTQIFGWLVSMRTLTQLNTQIQANLVELMYNFVTLRTPMRQPLLAEPQRNKWLQFAYRWAPFLSVSLALALVIARQEVAVWLLSESVQKMAGSSLEVARDAPGSIIVSIANSWLPSDSTTVVMMNDFYRWSAAGISALKNPAQSERVAEAAIRGFGFLTGTFVADVANWLLKFFTFFTKLHNIRFSSPLIHVFSLIEQSTIWITEQWRWAAVKLKEWVDRVAPERRAIHMFIDLMVDTVDFLLLMLRSFSQLFRYRAIILLTLALVEGIVLNGIGRTGNALETPPAFDIW